jgi:hypothetical protein
MSWITREGKVQQVESSLAQITGSASSDSPILPGPVMSSDNYDVFFFEGKAFHAVESERLLLENQKTVSRLDELKDGDDMDSLLSELGLPANFHLDIIDNAAFGDLLERLMDEP